MSLKNKKISSWHISVAAEAIAAGQFARIGYDISVQYGANQPEYDLLISKNDKVVKVSVKGSQDGSWGLTQNHLTKGKADYHQAAEKWFARHSSKTIFCLVQFAETSINEMPRMYLATPFEVANKLKSSGNGNGGCILYENHTWKRKTAIGYGTTEMIPDDWKFSKERLENILNSLI